ncbi:Acyl-coenzyme A synthetases/AMP-(fatty) acid ligases [Enhydrobacter sp. AX1]|nr:Acyl-coenzyme A synthetases/AMP-(fatty) acid ligases [Enhydrobacter sp. AX1]
MMLPLFNTQAAPQAGPRHYAFIEQLPKTAVGKIQKTQLRLIDQ